MAYFCFSAVAAIFEVRAIASRWPSRAKIGVILKIHWHYICADIAVISWIFILAVLPKLWSITWFCCVWYLIRYVRDWVCVRMCTPSCQQRTAAISRYVDGTITNSQTHTQYVAEMRESISIGFWWNALLMRHWLDYNDKVCQTKIESECWSWSNRSEKIRFRKAVVCGAWGIAIVGIVDRICGFSHYLELSSFANSFSPIRYCQCCVCCTDLRFAIVDTMHCQA